MRTLLGSRKHEILSNTLTGSEKKQQTFSKYMDVVQFTPQNFKIPESTLSFSPTKVSCKQAHQSFVSKKEQTTEKWTPMSDPIAARSSFTVQKLHSEHDFYDLFDVDPIALGANARNSPRKKGALKHTSAKRSCNRAQLYEGFDKRNSKKCMIKIINKTRLPASAGGERLWRKLCKKLLKITARHPGLMTISDVFETNDKFYIISEKMRGGELFDFLLGEKAVPEELCKYIIRQILQALDYLHSSYLVHRDIKPENVMFRRPRPTVIVNGSQNSSCGNILRDSKPAEYHDIYNGRRRLVGTYGYLAPEVLKGHEYTKISDLWSVGIILYILMTVGNNILKKIELFIKGAPPVPMEAMLNAQTSLEILEEIKNSGIDFQLAPFPEFPKAQDLCRSLLEFDPNNRIKSAKMALEHTWLTWTMSKVIPSPSLPVNQNEEWISTCSCEEESDSCQFAGNSALRLNIRMDNFASLGNADTPKLSTFWLNYDITKVPAR